MALVEKYSSLSFKDCLSAYKSDSERKHLLGDPLADLPLSDCHQRTFAVPPGIEACFQIKRITRN